MKLHYMGKYNLDPNSLPHKEHMPNAQQFKEIDDMKTLGIIANIGCLIIIIVLGFIAFLRYGLELFGWSWFFGIYASLLIMFPHELLHGICFKEDVYLYTDLKQGMLFVVGPETMSKARFIFMSLLPNIVLGFIPYIIGMIIPEYMFLIPYAAYTIGAGAADYYNAFNALTQMPKHSRTYLHKMHSYWYMPE